MSASGAMARAAQPRQPLGAMFGRFWRAAWSLLCETYAKWGADGAPRMAAALAYYTTLSIAPLLLVIIAVAGIAFGAEAVRGELVGQIRGIIGSDSAHAVEDILANARRPASGLIASAVGLVMLMIAASGAVGELENALNVIWKAAPSPGSIRTFLSKRLASVAMLLGTGFLLVVSLSVSALLSATSRYLNGLVPGNDAIWMVVEIVVSLAVNTALFAMLFKFLPDVPVRWSDVWLGAAVTAVLFNLGKVLIGLYLGRSSTGSAYGAAGSLVVVLVWIYYAAQILLFGAELTYVHASWRDAPSTRGNEPDPAAPVAAGRERGGPEWR
jgi:membrane protein